MAHSRRIWIVYACAMAAQILNSLSLQEGLWLSFDRYVFSVTDSSTLSKPQKSTSVIGNERNQTHSVEQNSSLSNALPVKEESDNNKNQQEEHFQSPQNTRYIVLHPGPVRNTFRERSIMILDAD